MVVQAKNNTSLMEHPQDFVVRNFVIKVELEKPRRMDPSMVSFQIPVLLGVKIRRNIVLVVTISPIVP